jgi:mannose/fructose/N-acetylgalactosamine-specific phosphotransferase system component IIC
MDPSLVIAGLFRIAVWAIGAVLATRARRFLTAAGFWLAAITNTVFTITLSHGTVPVWLGDAAVFLATPISALLVGGYLILLSKYKRLCHRCDQCALYQQAKALAEGCSDFSR